jgi:hypothetical protein
MSNLFTKEELLQFNEMMLGRGMPVEHDGIGYNKADFGACATYYNGLSDAQLADLAKRLVKYSETQLNVDKQMMKYTAKDLAEKANGADRSDGVSIEVREDGVLFAFRYNETFIEIIKKQPKRRFDGDSKCWIVPLENAVACLNELWTVGADVNNALVHIMHSEIYQDFLQKSWDERVEVLTKIDGEYALLKFDYNKDILEEIKSIDKKDRQWNADFKFWAVKKNYLEMLQEKLYEIAEFKLI